MKWVSHEVVTGMAVYTLTGALVPTACAMAGAVLPDWIEGKGGAKRWLRFPSPGSKAITFSYGRKRQGYWHICAACSRPSSLTEAIEDSAALPPCPARPRQRGRADG